MRVPALPLLVLFMASMASHVFTQAPSRTPAPAGPTFDVVSIRRNTSTVLIRNTDYLPGGGFRSVNIVVGRLIELAYTLVPMDIVGLPGWAMSERYDVTAASSLPRATLKERVAMMQAMLADRFKLAVHFENREQPVYDLVLARSDRRLGPGIRQLDVDCVAQAEAELSGARAAGTPPLPPQVPAVNAPAPCSISVTVDGLAGDVSMAILANLLRSAAGRPVVDKTGLTGSYHVTLHFDRMATLRAPDAAASTPSTAPSVFTAVQEQLGMKLESSRALRETLVIDRLERPTEN